MLSMSFLSRYCINPLNTAQSNVLEGHQGRLEEIGCWILRERLQRSTLQTSTFVDPVFTIAAGAYLGIDVAIKEVLPSTDYDVAKYFEREWRLMKSALKHSPQAIYHSLSLLQGGKTS